jgi:hypothetical protein
LGWVKRLRVLAGVTALALAVAACSIVTDKPQSGPTIITPGSRATTPEPGATKAPGKNGTQASPGQTNPGKVPPPLRYDDDGSVGTMSRVFLRRSPARALSIEFAYVSGRTPQGSAIAHLTSILRRELDKPDGITTTVGNSISSSKTSWTLDDLRALERASRSRHSGGSRATMWFAYVGGRYAENPNALAVTFSASASVIFRDRIDDAATSVVLEQGIERSVLVHEAGHMLALVEIGYRSRFDHSDAQHPYHSNNPDSVMYWAVEDISVRNILAGGPPDDFDDADRADLAQLRG